MWWFPSKNICQKSSGSVFMNCWRSPPCWSLIFCKTYKFLCNMWCVMCDAWCVMFQTWFFVRSWLYESRGDQKHPIWVISDLFNDIPKSIPGGSHMYTISCKAKVSGLANSSFPLKLIWWQNSDTATEKSYEKLSIWKKCWDQGLSFSCFVIWVI